MDIKRYINKNKIGGIILIIVIVIAFGFGGFGGGFMSNNQNNIVKINKTNVTTQDFINYINRTGISPQAIKDNLNNNIIEELLSGLISTKLLDLEIKDFQIMLSKNSLLKRIKLNNNFIDDNGVFQRIKYEKFLLENSISAPQFEKRLKDKELQKKLFNFIGSGTVPPEFLVTKLYIHENRKLDIDFIDLDSFYKKIEDINDQELLTFIDENNDKLKVEYLNFKYAIINPKNLIGVDEFNQEFFDKIDEIENNILNGVNFDKIISEFDLNSKIIKNYRYSDTSDPIEKKIYKLRNNDYDIFEVSEDFIIYKIDNIQKKIVDIKDEQSKKKILDLIVQKNKFDYNKKLLEKIKNKKFTESDFLKFGINRIKSITLNSIRDNKKFEINSVKMLYSLPINAFTLINDENNKIYLVKIKNHKDIKLNKDSEDYKSFTAKKNTELRNNILKSYDFFLNDKYKIDINQKAINNVKNSFQ